MPMSMGGKDMPIAEMSDEEEDDEYTNPMWTMAEEEYKC